MQRLFLLMFSFWSLIALAKPPVTITDEQSDFFAFCYHDVNSNVTGDLGQDDGAVNTQHLIQHFEWIKDNGYSVVSLSDIIAAKSGQKALPKKSIYLSFDDGYKSFYTKIYPLLKLYSYPATFAIVTNWIESSEPVRYGRELKSTADFLTWEQIREMQQSGLIEIASHSHNLHQGVTANPQGNTQPAATTRIYVDGQYEPEEAYKKRIYTDLKTSFDLIEKHTGQEPKAIVWPYGSHSDLAWEIAQDIGYQQSLVLEKGTNKLGDKHIQRFLVSSNPTAADISVAVEPYSYKRPHRAVHVDLDYVYDAKPEQLHKNLSLLLERIKAMNITHVYLQAFADEDGDGNASALYFPNQHLPVKADLFNRVAWQLKTRANVKVFAWMPVMAFDLGQDFYQQHGVYEWREGTAQPAQNNYRRLSIFSTDARQVIKSIYHDLGSYSYISGVLFHDDAFLTDFEDVSPEALEFYKANGMQFSSVEELRNKKNLERWTNLKTQALITFTQELADILRRYNGTTMTARNIYAQPILNPKAKAWFAQELTSFADSYDFTAVMAMPYMEQAADPKVWLKQLLRQIELKVDKGQVVLELQTIDWRNQSKVATETLLEQMRLFMENGFINYGYYPDDFITNHPKLNEIIKGMSLSDFPQEVELYD